MQILTEAEAEAEEFMEKKYETVTFVLTLPEHFKNATCTVKTS